MEGSGWEPSESVAKTPCQMQRRKHVKCRFLWAGKKPETTMAEFITSTTTRREHLGSTLAIGEWVTERVVNRSKYDRLRLSFTQSSSGHLLYPARRTFIRVFYSHFTKWMAASTGKRGSLISRRFILCVVTRMYVSYPPWSINAIFMEFTHC